MKPGSRLCYECAQCGAKEVRLLLRTIDGAYCQCDTCAYIWHDDHPLPQPDPPALRRKTDRRIIGGSGGR